MKICSASHFISDQKWTLCVWLFHNTPCPKKNGPFCFSSIFPSNLVQISKSGTVLKSAHSQLSKTVPDFEI